MRVFRLQKYDPAGYDAQGRYTLSDWTHVSDIGKSFGGVELTAERYLELEDRFVSAIKRMMAQASISALRIFGDRRSVRDLAVIERYLFDIPVSQAINAEDGEWISGEGLENFCRLCLRDIQGHALSDEEGFFIDFTGDYYVHFGMRELTPDAMEAIERLSLHVVPIGAIGDEGVDDEAYLRLLPRRSA